MFGYENLTRIFRNRIGLFLLITTLLSACTEEIRHSCYESDARNVISRKELIDRKGIVITNITGHDILALRWTDSAERVTSAILSPNQSIDAPDTSFETGEEQIGVCTTESAAAEYLKINR